VTIERAYKTIYPDINWRTGVVEYGW